MNIKDLFQSLPKSVTSGDLNQRVTGVVMDSREVKPGCIYIAVKGTETDGREFIPAAIKAGAVAVVSEHAPAASEETAWAHVPDSRAAAAALACAWNGNPSARMKVVGVTGTNGKTTTVFITHAIMQSVWSRAGLLGTVQVNDGEAVSVATHTTPGAIELQGLLRRMADNDCRSVAMEVSSHALEQKRVDGLQFDVAVFTNLTQDHLDYHVNMENYFQAKQRLFDLLEENEGRKKTTAVIHLDDPYGQKLAEEFENRLHMITYGRGVHCDLRIGNEQQTVSGTEFQISYKGKDHLVRTPYIGRFNVTNCAAAIASCAAVGISVREAVRSLADAPQVPGRMEHVGVREGANLFVDYAHTPDAVENACAALRELTSAKLITVFGCGGDRDASKRPLMGKAAADASDFCIVTSDNPRTEGPDAIIQDILQGMEGKNYLVLPDRAEAIQTAVNVSSKGDIILVAGKGHETYQEINGVRQEFDDRIISQRALKNKVAPATN